MTEEVRSSKVQAAAMPDREGKYLSFFLDREEYGIGILKIKEIIGMMPITPIPQTPESVKGVINLRGKVIPVIDLRLRFAMAELTIRTGRASLWSSSPRLRAVFTRALSSIPSREVLNIKGSDIEDTPSFGAKLSTDFILGMAKIGAA